MEKTISLKIPVSREFLEYLLTLPSPSLTLTLTSSSDDESVKTAIEPPREPIPTKRKRLTKGMPLTIDDLSDEIKEVIWAWNEHPWVSAVASSPFKDRGKHQRCFKDEFRLVNDQMEGFAKIGISAEVIKEEVKVYLDFCGNGGHVWDGTNHGFKSLSAFLNKLYKVVYNIDKEVAWWRRSDESYPLPPDDQPELTKMFIESVGSIGFGNDKYKVPDRRTYERMIIGRERCENFLKNKELPMSKHWIDMCIRGITATYYESDIRDLKIGHFTNDTAWSQMIPAYFRRNKLA